MTTPEARARLDIDAQLAAAGCVVQSMFELNVHAARGVYRITHSYALAITQIYAPDLARCGA